MEILDLVDDNDNVIGQEERNEALKKDRKNIRAINIFIYNKEGKILTPLRSANRRIFPNCYDFSVGGYVSSGEGYLQTAYRELEEELGIKNVELKEIGYFHPNDLPTSSFSKLYKLTYDGPVNYDKDGIAEINFFTEDEIQEKINKNPEKFKEDYRNLFTWVLENKED